MDRNYVLLLHDDDLIHPEYLDLALQVLDAHPGVNLLTANAVSWNIEQEPVVLPPLSTVGHLFSAREYATFVYNAGHPSYSLAIYRGSAFKTLDIPVLLDRYGKWGAISH